MRNFLEYTYEVVSKSLERHLYQNERKQIPKKKHPIELTGQAKLRSMLRDAKTNSKKLPMINGLSLKFFIEYQSMIFVSIHIETSPILESMTSKYSDVIANSIIALLKCDLRRVIFIKEKLFGQPLPVILRQFIWLECLFRFENKSVENDLVSLDLLRS